MKEYIIAGIGELLWDVLGSVEELGGAPVNFAYHTNSLGATGYAISVVGDDPRGRAALKALEQRNMSVSYIDVRAGATTGYVLANVDDQGVASYSFPDDVAWDHLSMNEKNLALASKVDAVCFGSLAQRSAESRAAIQAFLQATRPSALKILDLNLRQHFYTHETIRNSLQLADVLKLNDDELKVLQEMDNLQGNEQQMLTKMIGDYRLQLVVLTRGGKGSLLVSRTEISDHPGYQAEIVNTIGAGDSFTATTALGLLRGERLSIINERANRVAAFVCSQKGAMPDLAPDLRA
ncbi:MAG TPA: carbohydrate kinase [Chromatiaceae bacterium]|jgi:fructokinase|nr:MAG: hypothetical protein N838_00120 [Thiohalocapsa sp. PB-PSB1]QQO52375.1 MAG: carbohydrate kinase [Thiohalocapsa sp. PB-PSB1]HBG97015.1 carbohydrate kinase [Chromatiaceae bacterium]HCS92572.1 carbohydrate kinase [Chromatiaceae bacterium]